MPRFTIPDPRTARAEREARPTRESLGRSRPARAEVCSSDGPERGRFCVGRLEGSTTSRIDRLPQTEVPMTDEPRKINPSDMPEPPPTALQLPHDRARRVIIDDTQSQGEMPDILRPQEMEQREAAASPQIAAGDDADDELDEPNVAPMRHRLDSDDDDDDGKLRTIAPMQRAPARPRSTAPAVRLAAPRAGIARVIPVTRFEPPDCLIGEQLLESYRLLRTSPNP